MFDANPNKSINTKAEGTLETIRLRESKYSVKNGRKKKEEINWRECDGRRRRTGQNVGSSLWTLLAYRLSPSLSLPLFLSHSLFLLPSSLFLSITPKRPEGRLLAASRYLAIASPAHNHSYNTHV